MKKKLLLLVCSMALVVCSCQSKSGYAGGEQSPALFDSAKPHADEPAILQERQAEDDSAYATLRFHSGDYVLYTESEGVNATLQLQYNDDKTFNFLWRFEAPDAGCSGEMKGLLLMDRTQHGFYHADGCMVHFEFRGLWDGQYLVDLTLEENNCMLMTGNCIFSGTYMMGAD